VGRQALPAPGAGAPECWLRPKATLLRSKEAAPRRRQELVFIGCGLDREGIEARAPRPPPLPTLPHTPPPTVLPLTPAGAHRAARRAAPAPPRAGACGRAAPSIARRPPPVKRLACVKRLV
jgi:hypothetical protein